MAEGAIAFLAICLGRRNSDQKPSESRARTMRFGARFQRREIRDAQPARRTDSPANYANGQVGKQQRSSEFTLSI